MQRWEYLVLERVNVDKPGLTGGAKYGGDAKYEGVWGDDNKNQMSVQDRLNKLGMEGWELVSNTPLSLAGSSSWSGTSTSFVLCLKRLAP